MRLQTIGAHLKPNKLRILVPPILKNNVIPLHRTSDEHPIPLSNLRSSYTDFGTTSLLARIIPTHLRQMKVPKSFAVALEGVFYL